MALGKRKGGGGAPAFENDPPHQEHYVGVGDDNWRLKGTACAMDSAKINTQRGNADALTAGQKTMLPVYDSDDSGQIFNSHTNGKRG